MNFFASPLNALLHTICFGIDSQSLSPSTIVEMYANISVRNGIIIHNKMTSTLAIELWSSIDFPFAGRQMDELIRILLILVFVTRLFIAQMVNSCVAMT